jgi:hypothetical protein
VAILGIPKTIRRGDLVVWPSGNLGIVLSNNRCDMYPYKVRDISGIDNGEISNCTRKAFKRVIRSEFVRLAFGI